MRWAQPLTEREPRIVKRALLALYLVAAAYLYSLNLILSYLRSL